MMCGHENHPATTPHETGGCHHAIIAEINGRRNWKDPPSSITNFRI
jgi:hypothetical protein